MPQSLYSRELSLKWKAANSSPGERALREAARMLAGANSRGCDLPHKFFVLCTSPTFHHEHRKAQWLRAQILNQNVRVSSSNPISSTYLGCHSEQVAQFFGASMASPVRRNCWEGSMQYHKQCTYDGTK